MSAIYRRKSKPCAPVTAPRTVSAASTSKKVCRRVIQRKVDAGSIRACCWIPSCSSGSNMKTMSIKTSQSPNMADIHQKCGSAKRPQRFIRYVIHRPVAPANGIEKRTCAAKRRSRLFKSVRPSSPVKRNWARGSRSPLSAFPHRSLLNQRAAQQTNLQGVNFERRSPGSGGQNCMPNDSRYFRTWRRRGEPRSSAWLGIPAADRWENC